MLMHDPKRTTPYDRGDGYSRMIVYVSDIPALEEKIPEAGGTLFRKATRIEALKISVMLVRDPDGYLIEFVQRDS